MTEAHDLGFLRQRVHHPFLGAIGRLDFVEHLHRFFIRAAVQRTLQRPACARDRRVHVGQGRSRHARGKGRGVEFVIGIEDKNRVHHPDLASPAALRRSACRKDCPLGSGPRAPAADLRPARCDSRP